MIRSIAAVVLCVPLLALAQAPKKSADQVWNDLYAKREGKEHFRFRPRTDLLRWLASSFKRQRVYARSLLDRARRPSSELGPGVGEGGAH